MAAHKILIVDDEPSIREILRRNLEADGSETREAGSAGEAWQVLGDGWHPDVVFLDIVMPGGSGLELLREMKERFPTTEFVMMTAYASVESVQGAMRGGARDFLAKPFSMPQVRDAVERAIEKRPRESIDSTRQVRS